MTLQMGQAVTMGVNGEIQGAMSTFDYQLSNASRSLESKAYAGTRSPSVHFELIFE